MPAEKRLEPCLIIAGPTASGKSWLAERLAESLEVRIINGDSMQIYRGLEVISAQPDPADHHRLYGVLDPQETGSAAWWRVEALAEIQDAYAHNKIPLIVGGTGLYIKALLEDLSPLPDIPPQIREETRHLCDKLGVIPFYKALTQIDPQVASKLNPQDTQRLIRAYEVKLATGKSLLEWQKEKGTPAPYSFFKLLVLPPKEDLQERIVERFHKMLTEGALEEVKSLMALDPKGPAMKAIGVSELGRYLNGEVDLEEATDRAIIASRRLAKRQRTWFRNQFEADLVMDHVPHEGDVEEILRAFGAFVEGSL